MKIILKRHAGEYQVFRCLAIAQAIRKAGQSGDREVHFETFEVNRGFVDLTPEILFKHPHAPHGTGSGKNQKKLFDGIVDLDPPGIFDIEWQKAGVPWWDWVRDRASTQYLALNPTAIYPEPGFPEITASLDGAGPGEHFVLICPASRIMNPLHSDLGLLEKFAADRFGDAKRLWVLDFEDRKVEVAGKYATWSPTTPMALAWAIRNAVGVIAVNGTVAALAQSTYRGEILCPNFWYVQEWPETAAPKPLKTMLNGKPIMQSQSKPPGPFAGGLIETPVDPRHGIVLCQKPKPGASSRELEIVREMSR